MDFYCEAFLPFSSCAMPFILVCVRQRREVNRFFHTFFFGGLVRVSGAGLLALDNCKQGEAF